MLKLIESYRQFIQDIEMDPDSFTEGRRNDDLVNWYLATRIDALRTNTLFTHMTLMDTWNATYLNLTARQQASLNVWDMSPEHKLLLCHKAYADTPEHILQRLFLDQGGYATRTT